MTIINNYQGFRKKRWHAEFISASRSFLRLCRTNCIIGLMASVVISLAGQTLTDWRAILIAIIAAAAGILLKLSNVWLVIGGAVAGWLLRLL